MLSHANWPSRNDPTPSPDEVEAKARPELVWKSLNDGSARLESEGRVSLQRGGLLERYRAVRARSLALAAPLTDEDMQPQSMADASPVKWHLAHSSWFFETFILERFGDNPPFDADFRILFNSYYVGVGPRPARDARGLVTRPTVERVRRYRAYVDQAMEKLLAAPLAAEARELVELGLNHEEQHQELILTDLLHLCSSSPLLPAYDPRAPQAEPEADALSWFPHAGGLVAIGRSDDAEGFGFDNEGPRHNVWLEPFRLADRLTTNAEWLAFVTAGGYRDPSLWLSDGWAAAQAGQWEAPLYWRSTPHGWSAFGLHGLRPLDPNAPVSHVSYYEADAYARWRGLRLPTEAEWEAAAVAAAPPGEPELRQLYDRAWQWTSSAYAAYPGFAPAGGAVGEYNGKFMINQMVLRGGSDFTPPGHSRATYRNFFPPDKRWQRGGVRLAKDAPAAIDDVATFRTDVLEGLSRPHKALPSKWLYDRAGSALFEEICELPEYYLTRTELTILEQAAPDLAATIPDGAVLVEFGSGSSHKTRVLLNAAPQLSAYAPIDISEDALAPATAALRQAYPGLEVTPLRGDFTHPTPLPERYREAPRVGFFPGSTIGNFAPAEAEGFLRRACELLGDGSLLVVGVDLRKDAGVLEAAYDDAQGVTAAFNLNLLTRINRDLEGSFDLETFRHRAVWDAEKSRIEMRLESLTDQVVRVAERCFAFQAGETIHTENCYKYAPEAFAALAVRGGWNVERTWTADPPHAFAVPLLRASPRTF
jgi:dimethylhistidine N-methyltransferase